MSQTSEQIPVSNRLVLLIKSAYWMALLIIAAMAMASFLLLQQLMAEQQSDGSLRELVSSQKTLSQRIVFLAGAAEAAAPNKRPALVRDLRAAADEFEKNYDLFLLRTGADPASPAREDPTSIENVLFSKPFHLDYFSVGLAANGRRLAAALDADVDRTHPGPRRSDAGGEYAALDLSVANTALSGYAALGQRIGIMADQRMHAAMGEMPIDGQRRVYGGFMPILDM